MKPAWLKKKIIFALLLSIGISNISCASFFKPITYYDVTTYQSLTRAKPMVLFFYKTFVTSDAASSDAQQTNANPLVTPFPNDSTDPVSMAGKVYTYKGELFKIKHHTVQKSTITPDMLLMNELSNVPLMTIMEVYLVVFNRLNPDVGILSSGQRVWVAEKITDLSEVMKIESASVPVIKTIVPVNMVKLEEIRLKLQQMYEYELGKGVANAPTLRQIELIMEMFEDHVSGRIKKGFWNTWDLEDYSENIADMFDMAIATEQSKNEGMN